MEQINTQKSKFDTKTILILVLLAASTIFGLMWFFGGSDASKERVKQLEAEYKLLDAKEKAAEAKIADWQTKYQTADAKDKQLEVEITKLKGDSKIAEEKARKSKADLDKVQGGITENRKEIENLKKNPPVLSDDELLLQLTKKTN